MRYEVLLSEDAEPDIEDIYRYVAEHVAFENADRLIDALEDACLRLCDLPEQGNVANELQALGISERREVHYKPSRMIYRITGLHVIVYCVLDGRRDMQTLLHRRLLR